MVKHFDHLTIVVRDTERAKAFFAVLGFKEAMSVAIGIAHPRAASPPPFVREKMTAGTIMPPSAAAIGNAAWRGEASSPTSASRLISNPTSRKKTVINPSLIH